MHGSSHPPWNQQRPPSKPILHLTLRAGEGGGEGSRGGGDQGWCFWPHLPHHQRRKKGRSDLASGSQEGTQTQRRRLEASPQAITSRTSMRHAKPHRCHRVPMRAERASPRGQISKRKDPRRRGRPPSRPLPKLGATYGIWGWGWPPGWWWWWWSWPLGRAIRSRTEPSPADRSCRRR